MLDKGIKIAAYFFGALLTVMGIRWLIDPSGAAGSVGMELLDGVARSTQIGDLASFFFVGGSCALLGLIQGNKSLLGAAAALVGCTAIFRTLAYLVHGADFAVAMIVPEVVMFAAFMLARQRIGNGAA
jgi:hypothetical protein